MIYVLHNSRSLGNATTDFLPDDPDNVGDAPRCSACHGFIGMLQWLPPFCVELDVWGSSFGDIAFGPGDSLLVSGRFAALWRKEALVGLEGFERVEVTKVRRHTKLDDEPPPYLRVSVVRSDVAVDQKASGVKWGKAPTCQVCRLGDNLKGWAKVVLEAPPSQNVFIARGLPGTVIVDDRFRSFCDEHRFANVQLIPGPGAAHWF